MRCCTKNKIDSFDYRFYFCFEPLIEGFEGREVGGIYRRQNSGYPLFSVRVRPRRESLKVHQNNSIVLTIDFIFIIVIF